MGHDPRYQGHQHHRGGPRRQHDVERPGQGGQCLVVLPAAGCHGELRTGGGCHGVRRCRPHRGDSVGIRGRLHPGRFGRPARLHQYGEHHQRGIGPRLHPDAHDGVLGGRTLPCTSRSGARSPARNVRQKHVQPSAGLQAHDGSRPDGCGRHASVRLHARSQYRTGKGARHHRADKRNARIETLVHPRQTDTLLDNRHLRAGGQHTARMAHTACGPWEASGTSSSSPGSSSSP